MAIGPDSPERFQAYFREHAIPFRGIPDPSGRLLSRFGQEWRLAAFGRLPGIVAYGRDGREAARHLGRSMRDLGDLDAIVGKLLP